MEHKYKFELGIEAKSKITGFQGTIICRSEHLNGCNRYHVQPKVKKGEHVIPDGYWIDEVELVKIPKKKVTHKPRKTGGMHSTLK